MAPYGAEVLASTAIPPGMTGIPVGGMFISDEAIMDIAMTTSYSVTFGNVLVTANDFSANATGTNVMSNTLGQEKYGSVKYVSQAGSTTIFWSSLANPRFYGTNNNAGNIRQNAMYDNSEGGTPSVIYGTDDIASYQYNMIENPGPLAEMPNQPSKNFYGGRYNMEVLQEDRIMYRAGNAQNPYGKWFTSEPPVSVANVRIDTAVKPHWIDLKTGVYEASSYIDNVYAIKVPKGTTIYTGPVGTQGGVYVGGYNVMQTYIDEPWTFEVIGKTPLQ